MNPPNLTPWKRGDKFSAGHLNEMVNLAQAAEPLQVDGQGDLEYIWGSNGRGISSRKRRRPIFVVRMIVEDDNPGLVYDETSPIPVQQFDVVSASPYIHTPTGSTRNDPQVKVKVLTNLGIGDVFYATVPIGGTDRKQSSNPVVWVQVIGNDIRRVLISSAAGTSTGFGTGSGYYIGYKQYSATYGLNASTLNETLPDTHEFTQPNGHDCVIENSAENNTLAESRSHWIPPDQVYTFGIVVGHTNDTPPLEVIRVYVPPLMCECETTSPTNPYDVLIIDGYLGPMGAGGQTGQMTNLPELNGVGSSLPVGTKVLAKLINFGPTGIAELECSVIYDPIGMGTSCGTAASNNNILDNVRWLYFDRTWFASDAESAFDMTAPANAYYVSWKGFGVEAQNYSSLTAIAPVSDVTKCNTQFLKFLSGVDPVSSAPTGYTRIQVQWGIDQTTFTDPCWCGNEINKTIISGVVDAPNAASITGQECTDTSSTNITGVKAGVGIGGTIAAGVMSFDTSNVTGVAPITTAADGTYPCKWDVKLSLDTTALTVTSGNLTTIGLSDTESYITSITASGGTVTINTSTITYYNGLRQSKTTSSSTLSC